MKPENCISANENAANCIKEWQLKAPLILLVSGIQEEPVLEEIVSTGEITQGLLMKAARQVLMISLFTSFK